MSKKKRQRAASGHVLSLEDMRFVIPPSVFRPIEVLCRDALNYGANAAGIRSSVGYLLNVVRREAHARYGHDTADVMAISSLLTRTDPARADRVLPDRRPDQEPIQELFRQAHINEDQLRAADMVRRVETAWGRFLAVGARSYEGKSQKTRERALDPVWIMGDDVFREWREVYNPWYRAAASRKVGANGRGMVTAARIVIHVVMVPMFPGQIDATERLERGTSLRVLKDELATLSNMG